MSVSVQPGATDSAATESAISDGSATRPRGLADQLEAVIETWSNSHFDLVTLAAEFADSPEWIVTGSPTAAHWLAAIADIEVCTAREWIRIGRCLQHVPATSEALRTRRISYSKARALTRLATATNEHELLEIAETTTAGNLRRALAAWLTASAEPEDLAAYQHEQRSVKWRTEPDGMVTFTLRLPPQIAAILIGFLTTWVMTTRPRPAPGAPWPSVAQQHADGIHDLITNGSGTVDTEVVVHVRGDGNTLEDGTPLADSVVADLIPHSFIRALVYDSNANPIDATNRRRHPTLRQKRLVNARQPACVDCGDNRLLEYDHQPPFHQTGHTITTELHRRCAPCHSRLGRSPL